MSLSAFIHRRLVDLLEEHRIVVWYDAGRAFHSLATSFKAPNCLVVDTAASLLQSRREADRLFRGLNAPEQAELKDKNLLIYCPRHRGLPDDDWTQDPFAVFAVFGVAFGDEESQSLQSLARQALPERAAEIDRLFTEGRPTLAMLDDLKAGHSYPLVKVALENDSPLEAPALLLGVKGTLKKVTDTPGAVDEMLRLLHREYGYTPPPRMSRPEARLEPFGPYVLVSEFAFDLEGPLPEGLASHPVASGEYRERVLALCDRMRRSDDTREGYIELAQRLETQLRLREVCKDCPNLGARDTFPFEERHYLQGLQPLVEASRLTEAREIVAARRHSVWSTLGERAVLWKVAERCLDFLAAVEASRPHLVPWARPVGEHVAAYLDRDHGLWRVDRQQRLVEMGAADCAEDEEVAPLVEICRRRYRELAGQAQDRFLEAVTRDGWPPEGMTRQTQTFDRHVGPVLHDGGKVVYFLVDSLRYEMARDLGQALEDLGAVRLEAAASVLPTVTPFGMAALMPGADGTFKIVCQGEELVPSVGEQPLPGSRERMALLKERFGDRCVDVPLEQVLTIREKKPPKQIAGADLLVVRTQEIDSYGESPSLYQARKHMSGILAELVTATRRLSRLGFKTFVFAADHGHVLLPEVAPGDVLNRPAGEWPLQKRRCTLGHRSGPAAGVLFFQTEKLGIDVPVPELAVASGFRVFTAGNGYFHEGISLPECIVPVVVANVVARPTPGASAEEVVIRYRSDRFTSRVIGLKVLYNSLFDEPLVIRLEAYDGTGPKAKIVGEAADCDARDPVSGLVALRRGEGTSVPLRLNDDFDGRQIEVRAIEASGSDVVLARLALKNAMLV